MTLHTIIGSDGLIGSRLKKYLTDYGERVIAIGRHELPNASANHGHIYYCAGVTADFRSRPFETIQAHICAVQSLLAELNFDSFLYLSSTRVYQGAKGTFEEGDLVVNPNRPDNFYNLSKLMGEATCLNFKRPGIKVVRLSNVITPYAVKEPRNFFDVLLEEIFVKRRIELHSNLRSEKDYFEIDDVVRLMVDISSYGRERLYNVARGINTSHQDLIKYIRQNVDFDFEVNVLPDSPTIKFPRINVQKIEKEYGFPAKSLEQTIKDRIAFQLQR